MSQVAAAALVLTALVAPEPARPAVAVPAGGHAPLSCTLCHGAEEGGAVDCAVCHPVEHKVHPTDVVPPFPVPAAFPLVDGRLDCTSCHAIHEPQGRWLLRTAGSVDGFCAACHGTALSRHNPHRAAQGRSRCVYCHASIDVAAALSGQRAVARAAADRLCDYCHDVRANNHPRNIDPVLELPPELPRAESGAVSCPTCHDPHGSSRYTHYIREAYALHFERGRQEDPHVNERFACGACHVETAPELLTATRHELRFQGDANLLCVSCHVRARSHHPVGTPLPPSMAARLAGRGGLPLDSASRTTCITCHTNNCSSGKQGMAIRHYDAASMSLDLCWMCHPKEEFANTDPHRKHVDDVSDGCVFCHDRPPVKGLEEADELYFVSQVKMICLRCHEDLSDMDASHMGKPPTDAQLERLDEYSDAHAIAFPLDREGNLTCTTCHNAHFSARDDDHKTRLGSRQMCSLCHGR